VTIRLRLTLTYVALLVGFTAALLAMSWWLLGRHLERTLPVYADGVLAQLASQYVLAVAGAALVALGVGWLAAGHALAPLRRIASTARRVGDRSLDSRVRLDGPADEVHELADAFDAMLDRLQGAVEAQQRFVANASHELRTPLTVMRAEAEVALDDPDASVEDLRAAARAVVEETERTEALLDALLVLAQSTRGARHDEEVDLAAVARRAVAAARAEAFVQGDLSPAIVRGDRALLERLVGNLVENAVRHGRGIARLDVGAAAGRAWVRVVNGGEAIAPETLARLAEPFERGSRARAGGVGLGLSIVRAVAEAHGGALELRAPAGGGLDARVALPACAPARDPRGYERVTGGGLASPPWTSLTSTPSTR
jgi:signal transduction histidine kinase